jgi:phage shock protein PspC (stress-responsive transcriptional regulator)
VASGIARRIDVDAFVVRLALALAVTYVPVLAAAYALAWLVLPDGRTGRSLLDDASVPGRRGPALGVAALGAAALFLADDLGPGGDPGLTAGVVLLAVGYLLVTRQSDTAPEPDDDPPGPGSREPAMPAPAAPAALADGRARWLPPPPPRWRAPRPPRPPSHLGWFGLSALLVLAGALAVVDQAWTRVRPGVAVSIALLLLGGLLLVGARWGRARVLLPVGVLLLPLWLGLAASGISRFQGDGAVDEVVAPGDPLPAALRHGYGDLDIDLTSADLPPGSGHTLQVGLTAGRARIRVPREVHLAITGDVGLGQVEVVDAWARDRRWVVLGGVDRREGDPVVRCQPVEETVAPELGPDGFPLEAGQPVDEPFPPTTIVHRDVQTWEPCAPADPPDDPAVLELRLDVGIGTVEVHRV